MKDEYPQPKQRPINISTLNTIIGHIRKNVKQESNAPQGDTSSSSHYYDGEVRKHHGFRARHQHKIVWPHIYHALSMRPI